MAKRPTKTGNETIAVGAAAGIGNRTITVDDLDSSITIDSFEEPPEESGVSKLLAQEKHIPGRILGEGGMGRVFTAQEPLLHREVAIKQMLRLTDSSSPYWKRFMREAQITAQLAHPSIIPVYGLEFDERKQPYLVMKKIEGQTLSDYIASCTPDKNPEHYGEKARISKLINVCSAISYAHNHGVIHRDLKPDNIMVGAFDEIIVMDWGSARLNNEADVEGDSQPHADFTVKTMFGALVGTPLYMAPEQAKGQNQFVGPASDQFALGLILYEMIAKQSGRGGQTLDEVLKAASSAAPMPFGPDFSPPLRSIIRKATALKIGDRYDSVEALSADLRRYIRGEPVVAHPEGLIRRLGRIVGKHPVVFISLLFGSLLISLMMIISALSNNLDYQRQLQKRQQSTAALIATVSSRGRTIDNLLGKVQLQLHALTRSASLKANTASDELCVEAAELASHPSAKVVPEFEPHHITIEMPVCLRAPGVSLDEGRRGLELGVTLKPDFLSVVHAENPIPSVESMVAKIQWMYVGTTEGVLINYPGISWYPEEYDPRKRPWFKNGQNNPIPAFGNPYPDASGHGYLLPCTQRINDPNGNFVGVAGIDLELDRVITIISDHDGFILNEDNEIIIQGSDQGVRLSSEEAIEGNKEKSSVKLENKVLLSEFSRDHENGIVHDTVEQTYYAYARLQFAPWILVLRFSPDEV